MGLLKYLAQMHMIALLQLPQTGNNRNTHQHLAILSGLVV